MAQAPKRPHFPARIPAIRAPLAPVTPRKTPRASAVPIKWQATGGRHDLRPEAAQDRIPARARMVELLAAQGIKDAQVLRAFGAVDRRRFVDTALASQAYEDTALPIGLGQTISKPSVIARMVELLIQGLPRDAGGKIGRVLDIGTGCGYQALVLAQVAGEVYSIERLRALHERARVNLRPLRVANVRLIFGDGMKGYPDGAPYAAIVAAAGGEQVPEAWIAQLAYGGRIVAPVSNGREQVLMVVDKSRAGIERRVLETVNFVPLKSGKA